MSHTQPSFPFLLPSFYSGVCARVLIYIHHVSHAWALCLSDLTMMALQFTLFLYAQAFQLAIQKQGGVFFQSGEASVCYLVGGPSSIKVPCLLNSNLLLLYCPNSKNSGASQIRMQSISVHLHQLYRYQFQVMKITYGIFLLYHPTVKLCYRFYYLPHFLFIIFISLFHNEHMYMPIICIWFINISKICHSTLHTCIKNKQFQGLEANRLIDFSPQTFFLFLVLFVSLCSLGRPQTHSVVSGVIY